MPLQATSGAASYDGYGGGVPFEPIYIEQIFATHLYTGNGSTQTITNGIDLSGKGGLVWIKSRSNVSSHALTDTARGASKLLYSNTTGAQDTSPAGKDLYQFNSNGFTLGDSYFAETNTSGYTFASWTFRKQAKFFDVVTYTGNSTNRTIAHNLGSAPGCIIIKPYNNSGRGWVVYHRGLTSASYFLQLETTSAQINGGSGYFQNTAPTSTEFSLGTDPDVNGTGNTYVAYLFAHDAGGFGLTGSDNVITCGSFTTNGSGDATVNLGYEPQWVLYKRSSSAGSWVIIDNMRGDSANATNNANYLLANTSDAEATATWFYPTATGFTGNANGIASTDFIYIAIRRGPMKTPTSGTSVFEPAYGTGGTPGYASSFTVDSLLNFYLIGTTGNPNLASRLTGENYIATSSAAAEANGSGYWKWDFQTGCNTSTFDSGYVGEMFQRAPGFHDVVCYTGTGSATTFTHNLGVVPEMMIVKRRSNADNWFVYSQTLGNTKHIALDGSSGASGSSSAYWNNTSPTASVFSVGTDSAVNASASTYVNYLFASCPGVSKVGSYTGTGTTKQIDCGFTGGARFVLIKRTDSTGDWYVWDSARGIVAGNDPYYLLNSTAAQVTNTDYVDAYAAGFEISSTAPAAINANGGSFVFLAIA